MYSVFGTFFCVKSTNYDYKRKNYQLLHQVILLFILKHGKAYAIKS